MKLNKILIFAIFFTTFSSIELPAQKLKSIGVEFGTSKTNQTWRYAQFNCYLEITGQIDEKGYRRGFNGIFSLEWFDNNYLSMLTNFGFIQKGTKMKYQMSPEGGGDLVMFTESKISYLSFYPQLRIRKEFYKTIIPFLLVGPRIDYQLSYSFNINDQSYIVDPPEELKKVLFGLSYGLGLELKIRKVGIEFLHLYHKDYRSVYRFSSSMWSYVINHAFIYNVGIKYYFEKPSAKIRIN